MPAADRNTPLIACPNRNGCFLFDTAPTTFSRTFAEHMLVQRSRILGRTHFLLRDLKIGPQAVSCHLPLHPSTLILMSALQSWLIGEGGQLQQFEHRSAAVCAKSLFIWVRVWLQDYVACRRSGNADICAIFHRSRCQQFILFPPSDTAMTLSHSSQWAFPWVLRLPGSPL